MMGFYKAFYFLFIALAPLVVTHYLPIPYMDEFFHVRQTLQYVETLNFHDWDPKITTPPGLYAVAFIVCQFLNHHSLLLLRYVNSIPLLLTLFIGRRNLVISSFPLLVFYSTLFYTDVWSSLLIVAALYTKRPIKAALFSLLSLTFRQTNIIWSGLVAAFLLIPYRTSLLDLLKDLLGPRRLLSNKRKIASVFISFGILVALFALFLVWNEGIALGDRSNHTFSLHFAQLLYCLMFFAFYSAPLAIEWVIYDSIPQLKRKMTSIRLLLLELIRVLVEIGVIVLIIKRYTIVHPFILSDNRHYTFYLWRRFITKGLLMVPVYWLSWRWFASTVRLSEVRTWVYILAVMAVLVPSPLMEPRYYILPYIIWRVFLFGMRGRIIEYTWNTVINIATLGALCLTKTHFMY